MTFRLPMFALFAAATCAAGVFVQPEGAPPPPRRDDPMMQEDGPGARPIRERLEQRREQLRRAQQRLDLALRMLDDGASLDDVRREYPDVFQSRSGPGPEEFDGPPGSRRGARRDGPERFDHDRPDESDFARGHGADRPPTDAERTEMREFLRAAQPRLFQMLKDLEENDPQEAERRLLEVYPRLRPLLELRKADPELFELRKTDLRLGREAMEAASWLVRNEHADASERSARQAALKAAIEAQFDTRNEIQRRDLARHAQRIDKAREDIEKRAADRDNAIQSAMRRMLVRERERMDRGEPEGAPPEDGPPPDRARRPERRRGDR